MIKNSIIGINYSLTQCAPVNTTFGWIKDPPQAHDSFAILIKATVQGNSPKPASFVFPANVKSIPPTFLKPQPVGRVGSTLTGGTIGLSVCLLGIQQTSNTSWQLSRSNLTSITPNPSKLPSLSSVPPSSIVRFVVGSHLW